MNQYLDLNSDLYKIDVLFTKNSYMKYFTFVLMLLVFLASCSETETENEFISVSSGDVIMTEPSEEVVVAEIVEEEEEALPALDLSTAIFSGNGTEPFWGFNASGSTLILREPSDTGPMDLTTFTGVVMTNVGTSVSMTAP